MCINEKEKEILERNVFAGGFESLENE